MSLSLARTQVMAEVVPAAAVSSLLLNLGNRHHEMANFCAVLCITFAVTALGSSQPGESGL